MESYINSNRLFGAFFCLSVFLHFAVITGLPFEKLLKTGASTVDAYPTQESENVTIEFELESPPEVSEVEEEEPVQEKRLNFVDTSDNPLDEEPQGDTDKIGVKASIARDTYEGEEEENNQPHTEGNSTGLFLTEGESPFAETSPKDSEELNELVELFSNDVFEAESQLTEMEATASLPQDTEEKDGEGAEDKEGIELLENDPALFAQLKSEMSDIQPMEDPLELEDKGEIVPLLIPQQKQERQTHEAEGVVSPDIQPATSPPSHKKINRGAKKGSFVTYEDAISNAPISGEESFSVNKHEYAEYFQHIRNRISWYWFLSYGHDQSIKLKTSNRLPIIIEFKVLPSGMTDDVTIIDEAGNQLLAARIHEAIETTKLDTFPPHIEEEFIDVRFNFYFF